MMQRTFFWKKKNGPKLPHYERNNSKVKVLDNRL
jgi:hypothetical protein